MVCVSDAKFWVGRGETPSPQGIRIPDENGKEEPLRKYDNKTIVLTLPGVSTVTLKLVLNEYSCYKIIFCDRS